MNIFKNAMRKNLFFSFLFLSLPCILISMDPPSSCYPQLQLEQPKKQLPIISGTICIDKQTPHNLGIFYFVHEPVYYPVKWELDYIAAAGISVSPYEQCIPVKIQFSAKDTDTTFTKDIKDQLFFKRAIVPAKFFIGCSTGATIKLHLFGHHVELLCQNNPLINNEPFHKQFEMRMETFYKNLKSWDNMGEPVEKRLIPMGIIIKTQDAPDDVQIVQHAHGTTTYITEHCTYSHGPNGCPSDVHLAKQVIKPHNNSLFFYIMNRQTGQKLFK